MVTDESPNLQGVTFSFPELLGDNPAWSDGVYVHSGVLPGMTTYKGQFDLGYAFPPHVFLFLC
jgi:hypothetical protein